MVYIDYACGRAVGVGVEDTSLHSHGLQVEATPAAGRAGGGHWRAVNLTKTDCALPEPRTAPGYPTVKSHFQHHRCCMHATGSSGAGVSLQLCNTWAMAPLCPRCKFLLRNGSRHEWTSASQTLVFMAGLLGARRSSPMLAMYRRVGKRQLAQQGRETAN